MDGGAAKIRLEDLFPREFRALDVCQGPGGTLFVCDEDLSSRSGLILTLRYGLDIPKVRWTDSLELGDAALAAGAMALVPGEPWIAMVLDTLRGTLLRVNLRGGGVETVATSSDVPWLAEMDTLDITLPCTPIPYTPAPSLEYHVYHFARLAALPGEATPLAKTSGTYHPYAEGYVLDIGADPRLELPTPQR